MKLKELGIITIIPKGASRPQDKQQRQAYNSWTMMLHRCYDKTSKSYPHYGGRGLTVDTAWLDFSAFLKDIGLPPTKAHSIDRIDNDGNYIKENCRWATDTEQLNNTRRNIVIEYQGRKMNVTQWSRELKLPGIMLYERLFKLKWSVEKAFSIPALPKSMEKRRAVIKRLDITL